MPFRASWCSPRSKSPSWMYTAQQFNGREGETATLLSTGLFTLSLCGGGFAPRHLSRWAAFCCHYRLKIGEDSDEF